MEYFLLFALFTKNCIAPSQTDWINFFMYNLLLTTKSVIDYLKANMCAKIFKDLHM